MNVWHSDSVRELARYNGWTPALIENLSAVSERLTFDKGSARISVLIQECDTRKGDYIAQVIHADDDDNRGAFCRRDSYDENATDLLGLLVLWFSHDDRIQ